MYDKHRPSWPRSRPLLFFTGSVVTANPHFSSVYFFFFSMRSELSHYKLYPPLGAEARGDKSLGGCRSLFRSMWNEPPAVARLPLSCILLCTASPRRQPLGNATLVSSVTLRLKSPAGFPREKFHLSCYSSEDLWSVLFQKLPPGELSRSPCLCADRGSPGESHQSLGCRGTRPQRL